MVVTPKVCFCESQQNTWGVHKVLLGLLHSGQMRIWYPRVVKKTLVSLVQTHCNCKLAELGLSESGLCLCSPALGQGPMANCHAVYWRFLFLFCKASLSLVLFSTNPRNFRKSKLWFLRPLLSRTFVFLVLYLLVPW